MARDGKANGNSTSHELNKSLTMTSTMGFLRTTVKVTVSTGGDLCEGWKGRP